METSRLIGPPAGGSALEVGLVPPRRHLAQSAAVPFAIAVDADVLVFDALDEFDVMDER